MSFVAEHLPLLQPDRLLELGSRDVNGSPRFLFAPPWQYLGVDMEPGPGVDLVCSSHRLPVPSYSFTTVLCLEMLEHDPDPFQTMREIARVLQPGGTAVLSTRGIGFPLHEHPKDYWRFTEDGLRILLDRGCLKPEILVPDPEPDHPGFLCLARRSGSLASLRA